MPLAVFALAAAGCGGGHTDRSAPARPPVASKPSITPRAVVLRDQLFSVERRWPGGIAIADRLAIDAHGHGRIVRGGGGGGVRIEHCSFTAAEMSAWRRDLRRLGMRRPAATSPLPSPATYLIDYRGRERVVQTGAMPKRYRPFTQRITQLLYRGGTGCHTIYSQRRH